jgi:dienelactone hydrolase
MTSATDTRARVRALPRTATAPASRPRDLQDLAAVLEDLRRETRVRPYPMVAAATAVGFLLGGGMTMRVAATLFGAGVRAAALGLVTGFAGGRRSAPVLD